MLSRAECLHLEAVKDEMMDGGRSGVVGGGFVSSSLDSLAAGVDGRGGGGICDVLGAELLGPLYGALAIAPWVCWEGQKVWVPHMAAFGIIA